MRIVERFHYSFKGYTDFAKKKTNQREQATEYQRLALLDIFG